MKLLVDEKSCHVLATVEHQVALLSQSDSCHFLPFSCADSLLRRPVLTQILQTKTKNMTITSSSNAVLSACSTTFSRYCICSSESLPFMHLIIKRVCNQTCRSCCYFVLPRHMKKSTTHGTVGKGPLYSASLTRQKRVKIVINHRIIKP